MTAPVECRSAPSSLSFALSSCFLKSGKPGPIKSGATPILNSSKSDMRCKDRSALPKTKMSFPSPRFSFATSDAGSPARSVVFAQSAFFRVREKMYFGQRIHVVRDRAFLRRRPVAGHQLIGDAPEKERTNLLPLFDGELLELRSPGRHCARKGRGWVLRRNAKKAALDRLDEASGVTAGRKRVETGGNRRP